MSVLHKITTVKNIVKTRGYFGVFIVIISKLSNRLLLSLALEFDEIMLVYSLYKKNAGLKKQKSNFMFDVGARFGSSFEPFAKDDWRIYAFEPDSSNRKILINNLIWLVLIYENRNYRRKWNVRVSTFKSFIKKI